MRLVIIESKYAGATPADIDFHVAYARKALKHSLDMGEAPIASHLLYPQVLDDTKPLERERGIAAGLAWRKSLVVLEASDGSSMQTRFVLPAFYVDLGWSGGMENARQLYRREGIAYELRHILGQHKAERWEP